MCVVLHFILCLMWKPRLGRFTDRATLKKRAGGDKIWTGKTAAEQSDGWEWSCEDTCRPWSGEPYLNSREQNICYRLGFPCMGSVSPLGQQFYSINIIPVGKWSDWRGKGQKRAQSEPARTPPPACVPRSRPLSEQKLTLNYFVCHFHLLFNYTTKVSLDLKNTSLLLHVWLSPTEEEKFLCVNLISVWFTHIQSWVYDIAISLCGKSSTLYW